MKKYMKNYGGITFLLYRPWDLAKFREVGVPGPRKRLGLFPTPPDIFSKGHFANVTSSGGWGFAKYHEGGEGGNKDMKYVKNNF